MPGFLVPLLWVGGGGAAASGAAYGLNKLSDIEGSDIVKDSQGGEINIPWTEGSEEVKDVLDELSDTIFDHFDTHSTKGYPKLKDYIQYNDSFYSINDFGDTSGDFGLVLHDDTTVSSASSSMSAGLRIGHDSNFNAQVYTSRNSRYSGWSRNDENTDGKSHLQGVVDELAPSQSVLLSQEESREAFLDMTELMLSKRRGLAIPDVRRSVTGRWSTPEKNIAVSNQFKTFFDSYISGLTDEIKQEANPDRKKELLTNLTDLLKGLRYNVAPGEKDKQGKEGPAVIRERFSYQELSGIIKDATGKQNMVELLLDLKAAEIAEAKAQPNPKAQIQHLETIFAGIRESILRKDTKGNFISEPGLAKDYATAYNRVIQDFFPNAPSVSSYVLKNGMPDKFDNQAIPGEKTEIEKFVAFLSKPAKADSAIKVTLAADSNLRKLMDHKLTRPALDASSQDKMKYADQLQVLAILKRYFSDSPGGEAALNSLLSNSQITGSPELQNAVQALLKGYEVDDLEGTMTAIFTALRIENNE